MRTVLITGGSRGIGRAIAQALASDSHLLVGGRDAAAVADVVAHLPSAEPFVCDLTDEAAVAAQLGAHDALATHAREELGLTDTGAARPVQAALASAGSFAAGGIVPVLLLAAAPQGNPTPTVFAVTIVLLAVLGAAGAAAGGAPPLRGALRVAFWGAAAMIATTLIGHLAGVAL